jgi:hypothetical protein
VHLFPQICHSDRGQAGHRDSLQTRKASSRCATSALTALSSAKTDVAATDQRIRIGPSEDLGCRTGDQQRQTQAERRERDAEGALAGGDMEGVDELWAATACVL